MLTKQLFLLHFHLAIEKQQMKTQCLFYITLSKLILGVLEMPKESQISYDTDFYFIQDICKITNFKRNWLVFLFVNW